MPGVPGVSSVVPSGVVTRLGMPRGKPVAEDSTSGWEVGVVCAGTGTAEEEGVMMTLGVEQLPGVMRLLRWLSAGWMEIMGWPIMVAPAPLLPVRLMTGEEAAVTEVWLISSGVMYWDRGRISFGASFTPAASGDCVWGVDADTDGMTPVDWTFCTTGDCTFWKEGDCPFCTAGDPTEDIPSPAKAFTAEALALALARIMLRSLGLFLDPLGRPFLGGTRGSMFSMMKFC